MNFRKDINGLRAIAVMAVVLFHFQVKGFSGGFVGVDIFFVISGYLMTSIIFNKLQNQTFSLVEFYLHRARRIIPALAVLCLCLTLFGFLFLLKNDFAELSKYVRKAITFTSNIELNSRTNYFAASAKENWLLHTWSLSVEWQFYIIYPLIIGLLYRLFSLNIVKVIVLIFTLLSLLASIIYTPLNPSAAFYLLPTRAWEMLAGGIIFLFPLRQTKYHLPIWLVGILCTVVSILVFNNRYLWPSYFALLPVIGTMLIIWSQQAHFITDNSLCQWLGKISYSIYLWHWPLAVFLTVTGKINHPVYVILCIALSIALGFLSYHFIETRNKLKHSYPIEILKYILIIALISLLARGSYLAVKKNMLPRLAYLEIIELSNQTNPMGDCLLWNTIPKSYQACKAGSGEVSAIVLGDSYADAMFTAVAQANPQATLQWTFSGCFRDNDLGINELNRKGCNQFINDKLAVLKQEYINVPILFIHNTVRVESPEMLEHYTNYYKNIICEISAQRPVYIIKPNPIMPANIPSALSFGKEIILPRTVYDQQLLPIEPIFNTLKTQCNAIIVDPSDYLCDKDVCRSAHNGIPYYYDNHHLNEFGNKLLLPLFKQIFNQSN